MKDNGRLDINIARARATLTAYFGAMRHHGTKLNIEAYWRYYRWLMKQKYSACLLLCLICCAPCAHVKALSFEEGTSCEQALGETTDLMYHYQAKMIFASVELDACLQKHSYLSGKYDALLNDHVLTKALFAETVNVMNRRVKRLRRKLASLKRR